MPWQLVKSSIAQESLIWRSLLQIQSALALTKTREIGC
jgi:hypothetical protein